jgi:hypothetical protein
MYDEVRVPCPVCGRITYAQSKGGGCALREYGLDDAPADVLGDINRHAPFVCECGAMFNVRLMTMAQVVRVPRVEVPE